MKAPRSNSAARALQKGVWLSVLIGLLRVAGVLDTEAGEIKVLNSPDGRIQVSVRMPAPGTVERPRWSATFHGKPVLKECGLGLQTADACDLMVGARVLRERSRSVDDCVPVLFGKADHADDRFREIHFTLETPQHRRTDLVFRCYNDAIALRYELPANGTPSSVTITNETTSFRLESDPTAFVQYLENYTTSHENNVNSVRYRDMRRYTLLDMQFTFSCAKYIYAALLQAALSHS